MSCISSTATLHTSSVQAERHTAELQALSEGARAVVSVRSIGTATLRAVRKAEAVISTSHRRADMQLSQICPIHYGINLLADDGETMLAWDDGTLVKW